MAIFTRLIIDGFNLFDENSNAKCVAYYYVLNHITKKKEPSRSDNFSMSNVNDIIQVEVPELVIHFNYLDIATYRELFKITRKPEFLIQYYDQDYDMNRTNMFYYVDHDSLTPLQFENQFKGIRDFEMHFICTMNPISGIYFNIHAKGNNSTFNIVLNEPYVINGLKKDTPFQLAISTSKELVDSTQVFGSAKAAATVEMSFTNSGFTTDQEGNKFTTTASEDGSVIVTITPSVSQAGDYYMFLSAKEYNNEGNSTSVSILLRVVD